MTKVQHLSYGFSASVTGENSFSPLRFWASVACLPPINQITVFLLVTIFQLRHFYVSRDENIPRTCSKEIFLILLLLALLFYTSINGCLASYLKFPYYFSNMDKNMCVCNSIYEQYLFP